MTLTPYAYIENLSLKYRNRALSNIESEIFSYLSKEPYLTYNKLAEKLNYSSQHVSMTAKELFGLISQETRLTITKTNFYSTIQHILRHFPEKEEFKNCHGLNPQPKVDNFSKNEITVNLSTFWKYDAINKTLILKSQYPIVIDLNSLTLETVGQELLFLVARDSLKSPYALQELILLLNKYLL